MEFFREALMDTYHAGGIEYDYPCRVRVSEEFISVEYDWGDEGVRTYRGFAKGPGHYELEGDGFRARATLHRAPGTLILNGFWIEDAQQGMWRIRLNQSSE